MKKSLIVVALSISIFTACGIVGETGRGYGYYDYPEQDTMNAKEYMNACRISQEILNEMSNEELAQAIVDFPFLMDIFFSSQSPPELVHFEEECDAYKELLLREDGKNALMDKAKELSQEKDVEKKYKRYALKVLLLYSDQWKDQLTEEEKTFLENY